MGSGQRDNFYYFYVYEIPGFQSPIMDAIYGSHIDPHKTAIMEDMRARLGAQALNSVINTKIYPEGLLLELL
jgi:hypothetical protein